MAPRRPSLLLPCNRTYFLTTLGVLLTSLIQSGACIDIDHSDSAILPSKFQRARSPNYVDLLSAPAGLTHTVRNLRRDATHAQRVTDDVASLVTHFENFHHDLLHQSPFTDLFLYNDTREEDDDGAFGGESFESENRNLQLVEALLASLADLSESGASSQRCVNDSGHVIISMFQRQRWALKFLDSTGKPGPGLSEFRFNFVGDYDLCRSLVAPPGNDSEGFRGNYVTMKASVGPPDLVNPLGGLVVQWGVCMPSTCTDDEVTALVDEALQVLGLNKTLYTLPAESHNDKREATKATIAAIIIILVIGSLLIVGTLYDILYVQWPQWIAEWMKEEGGEEKTVNLGLYESQKLDLEYQPLLGKKRQSARTGKLVQALLSFSVYTNGSKALNTSQPPGSITCLHGIRFLSMTWVILGHTYYMGINFIDNAASETPKLLHRWTFDAVANALLSVDTFFTMSGFLVAYVTIKEMRRTSWKLNWGLIYFHRFWRLTPPYMLAIVLVLGLQQYMGQGPLWSSVQPDDKQFCEDNWWTNLLYVNNLVGHDEMCFGHTWYLANDMQFFLLTPLMLIPFYFNAILGFATCGLFLLTSWITTGILSTQQTWPTTFLVPGGVFSTYFNDYYIAPWCRIGPYIVGVMTGYLVASRPKVKLSSATALLGWLAATAMALAALYGLRGDISGEHFNSQGVASFYNAVGRSAWGASICWLIVACVAGWGGFVNKLLSWSPFVVLSRLTYMAYLIHLAILSIYFGNMQTLFHLTDLNVAIAFMGILVTSYACAFVLMLALESPMIGLEKVFLPKRRKD